MIATTGRVKQEQISRRMFVGELALDGTVRPVPGTLAIAFMARQQGLQSLVVPAANAAEAAVVEGLEVLGVQNLAQTVRWLSGEEALTPARTNVAEFFASERARGPDFADIKGQEAVKRAMEVAAAGGHNVLMIGPPGAGKSMTAKRLASILPLMTLDEALETTKIHSVCGKLTQGEPLVVQRPFRAPHHTISDAGLLGGQSQPTPGEISLAHHGVLFLDELPEFRRSVLEVLRQPLEDGLVTIARAAGSLTFPARFQLVAAMNPCPCGYFGSRQRACRCGTNQIERYRARISGPLLDRIDLHVEVCAVSERELLAAPTGERSAVVRARVEQARVVQQARFAGTRITCNAMMDAPDVQRHCLLDDASKQLLRLAINDLSLSARAYDRVLRVARTLADLAGREQIGADNVSEAIQYRTLDRRLW